MERIVGMKKAAHHSGGGSSPEQKKRTKWEPTGPSGGAGGGLQIPAMGPITKPKPAA